MLPHSSYLHYWRIACIATLVWAIFSPFLLTREDITLNPAVILLVLPLCWVLWWGRQGHYKPVFISLLCLTMGSVFLASHLTGADFLYGSVGLILTLIAFYTGFKHLRTLKQQWRTIL